MPLDEAFAEAAERTGSRDLGNVGMVAALQRDLGGNGAETLDRIVETIRGRDDLRRLVTTLTAQGRLSHWILTALPMVIAGALLADRPRLPGAAVEHRHWTTARHASRSGS